ncbi:MAG: hypothetical protein E7071_05660 [Bacteroidales bacterium]|nr:hypothetical protein [Bacteroidales bacterium]
MNRIYLLIIMLLVNIDFVLAQKHATLFSLCIDCNNYKYYALNYNFRKGFDVDFTDIQRKDSIHIKNEQAIYNFIDSLNIVDFSNDTIYIFEQDSQYYIETKNICIAKGITMLDNPYSYTDTLIITNKHYDNLRVSWIPKYVYDACIQEDTKLLGQISTLNDISTSRKEMRFSRIIVDDYAVKQIEGYLFPFESMIQSSWDQLQEIETTAIQENRYFKKSQFPCEVKNIDIHLCVDHYQFKNLIRRNKEIYCWYSLYVFPLIKSLKIIDESEDTVNFKMVYSPNGIFKNLCIVKTNSTNLYLFETRDKIIWDTINPSYMEFYNYTRIMERSKLYGIYIPPYLIGESDIITSKFVLRDLPEYNHFDNKFYIKNISPNTRRMKRYEELNIYYRAEILDSKIIKSAFNYSIYLPKYKGRP